MAFYNHPFLKFAGAEAKRMWPFTVSFTLVWYMLGFRVAQGLTPEQIRNSEFLTGVPNAKKH